MTGKQKTVYTVGGVAGAVLLYLLWRSRAGSGVAVAPASASPGGGMFYPPTPLSMPDIPASVINLTFQDPSLAFRNQPTGYTPLFGFLGYSGQWA